MQLMKAKRGNLNKDAYPWRRIGVGHRHSIDLRLRRDRFRRNRILDSKFPYKLCNISKLFHNKKPSLWLVKLVVMRSRTKTIYFRNSKVSFQRNLTQRIRRSTADLGNWGKIAHPAFHNLYLYKSRKDNANRLWDPLNLNFLQLAVH